jgi:hypothetical protein
LTRAYLLEFPPNHNQKQFASWFRKRKGKQRLKRREKETIISFDTSNELSYLDHEDAEKHVGSKVKIYLKKKKQIQGSSLDDNKLIIEAMENSIIYENFKRFIEEAKVIFSTNQKMASRNRQVQEAHALSESEREKAESTKLLKKILKSINIANINEHRTLSLPRIALRNIQKVTAQMLQENQKKT